MISLYEWAKREGISYSHAQKLLNENKITGAVRIGSRIKVPENCHLPKREMIECQVCHRMFSQLTANHLQSHGLSWKDYQIQFPNAKMIADDIVDTIKAIHTNVKKTQDHKDKISASKKGTEPWNKGRTGNTLSENTKQKMAVSHTGLKHTEDAKQKIGDAHRGVAETPEAVKNCRLGILKFYETNPGFFTGHNHTDETKKVMSEKAKIRESSWTEEEKAEIYRKRTEPNRGKVRTPEQRETYSEARSKFMEENPHKVVNTAGERTIQARLESKGFEYKKQFRIPGVKHPYDFFLPEYNVIIEFDGSHHWLGPWFKIKDKSAEEREMIFYAQLEKDAMLNMAAGRAGYRIIRLYGRADVGCKEWGTFDEQLLVQNFPELME